MRKHYRATFKAQIVQEVLRGEKTMSHIASEHDVYPNLIGLWKATAIERFPSLFERENADRDAERVAHDKQLRELYEEIGRLTTQVASLNNKFESGYVHVGDGVSIIIPVYNSAPTLSILMSRLTDVVNDLGLPYEIVLVNDGSRDTSWEQIERLLMAKTPVCRIGSST